MTPPISSDVKEKLEDLYYNQKNKEKINKKRSEKIKCECGDYISRNGIKYHITTQLHKDIIRMNELD